MMFFTVDFPAPFSPANATTSPPDTVKDTFWTAATPPNDFDTLRTTIAGAPPVILGSQFRQTCFLREVMGDAPVHLI
ncbi:hypothetical protein ACIOC1_33885 [Streptomyces sp. NPDC088197]|uniref:hypothetical protein n=1 Tax=Streptomyces sp. NPDC088197 TaxID=3365840 RepID=UPI0037FC6C39